MPDSNRRAVTPYSTVELLATGEFRQGPDYTNWRPGGTPDWLLIYTLAGGGRIAAADGQEWVTVPGEIVLYEPQAHQDYGTAPTGGGGAWRLRWAHFHPRAHWLPTLRWPGRARGLRWLRLEPGEPRRRVERALAEAVRWHGRREIPGHVELAANALERALLWAHAAQADGTRPTRADERVRRAVQFLGEEWREPFSLARLAARCGLSVSRLAHLFKAQVGDDATAFRRAAASGAGVPVVALHGPEHRRDRGGNGFRERVLFFPALPAALGQEPVEVPARGGSIIQSQIVDKPQAMKVLVG